MNEQTTSISAEPSLLQEMGITDKEIAQRKAFLEFGDRDIEDLTDLNELAQQYSDSLIESFYTHLLSFEETRAFFRDPKLLEYVKNLQKEYFLGHAQGNYDKKYIEGRLKIGAVHERIGLPIKSYLGMYNFYLRNVANPIFKAYEKDPKRALRSFLSLLKLVFLDMGLAIDTYLTRRERVMREQQETLRELPTPVLQVRERLLILPIIGVLDSHRARQLTEQLLNSIRGTRAKVAILDITGVALVDSKVANHLLQTVSAARLMGATVILTGLSPQIAQALVAIGVDLSHVKTTADLQDGLEQAEQLLGYQVVMLKDAAAQPPQN